MPASSRTLTPTLSREAGEGVTSSTRARNRTDLFLAESSLSQRDARTGAEPAEDGEGAIEGGLGSFRFTARLPQAAKFIEHTTLTERIGDLAAEREGQFQGSFRLGPLPLTCQACSLEP